jgi:hypothetical protein
MIHEEFYMCTIRKRSILHGRKILEEAAVKDLVKVTKVYTELWGDTFTISFVLRQLFFVCSNTYNSAIQFYVKR